MELYTEVLSGRILECHIEAQARRFRSQAWQSCGSAFGPRSLDARNENGWSLGDALADPDALESLEAVAALAYEMDD